MTKRKLRAAALVGAILLAVPALSVWPAAAAPKGGERVTITACPFPGGIPTCLMMRSADGTIYNITAASPKPRPGILMIRLRGIVTDKFSICGQGLVLERIRWTRTRLRCPN
jgi:hypothetical protein